MQSLLLCNIHLIPVEVPQSAQLQDSVLIHGRDVRNGGYAFGQQEKLRLLTYKIIHVCTAGIPHDDGRESLNICIFTTRYQMMNIAEIKDMVRSASGITEFQRRVYLALLDVPKGSMITYGELAITVGCKSPRAIGNALHKNPFAPLVPCHRVIRANGEIGGYAFGQQEKLRLLREEGAILTIYNHL